MRLVKLEQVRPC